MNSVVALSFSAMLLLWWWPRAGSRPESKAVYEYWTDVRSLRFLQTNSTSAQTLTAARASMRETSRRKSLFDDTIEQRLDALSTLETESGIPVSTTLSQLHFEAETREILLRMWNEKAAVAYTSSNSLIAISGLLLLMTSGSGSLSWVLNESAGRLVASTALALIFTARWSLRRSKRAAQRIQVASPRIQIGERLAAWLVAASILMLLPNALGVSCAIVFANVTRELMRSLPSLDSQFHDVEFSSQRGWVVALLQSGIASGHDWLETLTMIHPHLNSATAPQVQSVITRLQWGLAAEEAFDSDKWQEIAHIAKLVQEVGVRAEDALESVRNEINNKHRSHMITHLERVAARAVVPVSLLQLPAFILLAIVPVVATQFTSLLNIFQSTGMTLA